MESLKGLHSGFACKYKTSMEVTGIINKHSNLIFAGKSGSLLLKWSLIRGSTLVGFGFACKYKTSMEVTGIINKHSNLIFAGKARSLPVECSLIRGSTGLTFGLACKH